VILVAAFAVLTLICVWRRSRALAGVSCLLAFVAAGALVAVTHPAPPAPQLDTEGPAILAGCVVEPSALSPGRDQFLLELEPGARVRVSLYVPEGKVAPVLRYGQRVEFDARVRPTRNFNNPGAFDYVHYMARQNVYWTASARATTPLKILPGRCGSQFMSAIFTLRTAALDRIERLYAGQPYETGMMEQVLMGESSKIEKVWTEQYRSTGTYHAMVIAGLHVAILAAFLMFLLRICLVPRELANLLTVLAAWLYALVTGGQAPAVRSAAGFTLFMIARLLYGEARILNVLAAAAIGFLLLDPDQIFDASFRLSFLAVAFIGAFVVPLVEKTSGPLAAGVADLADPDRGLRLDQRRAVSRRNAIAGRNRLPVHAVAAEVLPDGRRVYHARDLFFLRAELDFGHDSTRAGAAYGHLLPPGVFLRSFGQCLCRPAAGHGDSSRIHRRFHWMERACLDLRMAAGDVEIRR
jgi:competence protein ComEC